jgi:hypothetical protein
MRVAELGQAAVPKQVFHLANPDLANGGFRAAIAAASAGIGVGPGAPIFLVEELQQDRPGARSGVEFTERSFNGVLIGWGYDTVDENVVVDIQQREVYGGVAEDGWAAGSRDGWRHLVFGAERGDHVPALVDIFAGAHHRIDEAIGVSEQQGTRDPRGVNVPANARVHSLGRIVTLSSVLTLSFIDTLCSVDFFGRLIAQNGGIIAPTLHYCWS